MNEITYDGLVDLYNRASIIGYEGIESVTSTDSDGAAYTTLLIYNGNKDDINNIYICIPSGFKNNGNPGEYAENIQKAIESLENKTILALDQKRNINKLYSSLNIYLYGGENMQSINCMFMYITATLIDLSNFKPKELVEMDSTFNNVCAGTIELGDLYTGKVKDFEACFYGSNIGKIDLSKLDVKSAETMDSMFSCALFSEMECLDLSKWETINVKCFCHMFKDFELHGLVDLSNFTTKNVNDISILEMFTGVNFDELRFRLKDENLKEELNDAYVSFVDYEQELYYNE